MIIRDGTRTLLANEWPDVSGDRANILARLEESEFAKGNTANGRKPSYKPEYAEYAKAMCERGATTDELADALGVSADVIGLWQRVQPDFFEACKLTPACIERVKRSIFESAVGKIAGLEKPSYLAVRYRRQNREPICLPILARPNSLRPRRSFK